MAEVPSWQEVFLAILSDLKSADVALSPIFGSAAVIDCPDRHIGGSATGRLNRDLDSGPPEARAKF